MLRSVPTTRTLVRPLVLVGLALAVNAAAYHVGAQADSIAFTSTEGTWISLDIAPDGEALVFELLGDIYRLPADGGRARPVVMGRAFQSQPRYAPDGARLVYVSDESGFDNLWVAATDGTGARQITTLLGPTVLSPEWAPDGSALFATVVTSAGFSSSAEIWRFDLASGERTRVVENMNGPSQPLVSAPAPGPYGPSATSAGDALYFTSVTPRPYGSRSGASSAIMRVDLASGRARPVLVEGANPMKPRVSPDGQRLVYAAMQDGRTGLKVRDVASGSERWLAYPIQRNELESRATRDVLPNFAIAPDGRSVFLEWNGQIHRLGLDDESDRVIPFVADVALEVEPRLTFPQRVDTGPVRVRRVQQLATSRSGSSAFSALARIWVVQSDGMTSRRLTRTVRPREFMPAWSPDDVWVAYVTWSEDGGHLWKARADGSGEPVQLSRRAALWADPVWTPDGSAVVALRGPLGSVPSVPVPGQGMMPANADLVVVPASGGGVRVVAPADGGRRPHFGPLADEVFMTTPSIGLVAVDLRSGIRRTAASAGGEAARSELRVSPDGRRVLAIGGGGAWIFAVPGTGLAGEELAGGRAIPAQADAPADISWSDDGSTVTWMTATHMVRLDVTSASASPIEVAIRIEVPRAMPTGVVVLRGGKVVTMNGDEVVEGADVVVRDNRIAAVGVTGTVPVPVGATIVDVSGKVLVPGFIDVHAHFTADGELLEPESTTSFANLAYGVTTVRNPQTSADVFALADVIAADGVPAPRVFSTGPGLFSQMSFESVDDARRSIARYRDDYGTHLLKWYMAGSRRHRQSLIGAAREGGMMPTTEGGADTKANLTYAIDGFSGLEHAFPVAPIRDDLVQLVARAGITYTPTLVVAFGGALPIYRLLAEKRPHENPKVSRWFPAGELFARSSSRLLWFPPEDYNDRDVGAGANAILQAGGRVALGGHGEVQGLSAHWEMELLARGGMSNHDVLRVATIFGAEAIGFEQDLGSVEVGKLADLVVLDRDPMTDIEATQAISYVMKNGVLYNGGTLDQVWPDAEPLVVPWRLGASEESDVELMEIETVVRRTMEDGRIPGAAVAVVRRGEVLMSKGFGVANLETGTPVTTETMFESGSLGKQWTSAGIMALVEDGRIDLDASVRTYIAEAPASWQPITIRHLLTHSSGIPDYTSDTFDYGTNYSEADLVRMASGLELEFPAGSRWNYSNTGYVVLGIVMSRVTAAPYWEFLRRRIFDPAGMPSIRIISEADVVPHRARGYLPIEGGWANAGYVAPMTNTTADGSMLLSIRDLVAWNEVVANRRILSSESWALILSPMTLNSGRSYPYGYGWFIEESGGQVVHQHGGSWQGFVTQLTRFTDDDLAVMILANARSLAVAGLPNSIAALVDPELVPDPLPMAPIVDSDPAVTGYVSGMLTKIAAGELELRDFAFLRQTIFPRMRAALTAQLEGMGAPDRLELLSAEVVGDDPTLQYWAWYGDRRFRVLVSLGPEGGLTALRLIPDGPGRE